MSQYLIFSSIAVKEGMVFRINLFTSLFGGVFRLILLASVWKAVYLGRSSLAGYGQEEILFYVVIAATMSAGGLLSVGALLGQKNDSGDIVVDLIRPVSLPWRYFFACLGELGLSFWIKVVPTLLIGFIIIQHIPHISRQHLAYSVFLFMGGSFLHYWLNLGLASFAFRTKSSYGLNVLWAALTAFMAGLIVPIAFYPESLQQLIFWTPFPSIFYTPMRVLMGGEIISGGLAKIYMDLLQLPSVSALLIEQLSWIILILPAATWIFKWNKQAVDIQGG
jgi:ABC-2 type transport system permease protein